MKIGLVLEGGAMRAIYSAGVLDVMMQHRIKVDGIVAVSAGALFGVNYFSHQIKRSLRYNLKYAPSNDYMGFKTFVKTGNIVNKEFAYYQIPQKLDPFDEEAFERYDGTFHVAITNVATGQAEYALLKRPLQQLELLRATSAMPFVSQFVQWEEHYYLDGGIVDSIPLSFAKKLGFDKLIVVLTRPIDYRKKASRKLLLANMMYRHYPQLQKAIQLRHERYNQTVEQIIQLEQTGDIFVIRPSSTFSIKRLERNRANIQAMYDLGVKDGLDNMEQLKAYIT